LPIPAPIPLQELSRHNPDKGIVDGILHDRIINPEHEMSTYLPSYRSLPVKVKAVKLVIVGRNRARISRLLFTLGNSEHLVNILTGSH
jgi:hypothetical protein